MVLSKIQLFIEKKKRNYKEKCFEGSVSSGSLFHPHNYIIQVI